MPYFTETHLRRSLDHLKENAHPLLVSLLAMFRKQVPTSSEDADAVRFGARDELQLLEDFLKPVPDGDRPYFMPFGRPGRTRWRENSYPGKSLQRLRSDHPDVFRQHSTDNRRWSLAPGYAAILAARSREFVGAVPFQLGPIAALFYRARPFASVSEAVEALIAEFHLQRDGLIGPVLTKEDHLALGSIDLSTSPLGDQQTLEILSSYEPAVTEVDEGDDRPPAEAHTAEAKQIISAGVSSGDWELDLSDLGDLCGLRGLEEPATRALAALRAGKHVVFTGAPGSGKTKLAECLCKTAGFPFWTVPATDQWTTFEVIGGYFPVPDQSSGQERLEFLPGHVVESLQKGKCLIVDEINRADMDKAFGELLTLLSGYPVTLPYKWRQADGALKRIQLHLRPTIPDPDTHVIVVPDWWRILGAMNDADKASLKRLSLAFVRRFAFVPVTIPTDDVYEALLWDETTKLSAQCPSVAKLEEYASKLVELFARSTAGLSGVGTPMGPAIPLTMLSHGSEEWRLDAERTVEAVLLSALDLYLAPQLQGRADLHEKCVELLGPQLGDMSDEFERSLTVWTGYMSE